MHRAILSVACKNFAIEMGLLQKRPCNFSLSRAHFFSIGIINIDIFIVYCQLMDIHLHETQLLPVFIYNSTFWGNYSDIDTEYCWLEEHLSELIPEIPCKIDTNSILTSAQGEFRPNWQNDEQNMSTY